MAKLTLFLGLIRQKKRQIELLRRFLSVILEDLANSPQVPVLNQMTTKCLEPEGCRKAW